MGHTLLSVLLLHLLNTLLYYGHAQVLDAVLMTEPNWSTFFTGESVTFICDMNEGDDADWEYKIKKDGGDYVAYNTSNRHTLGSLSTGDSGDYQCVGRRRSSNSTKSSNTVSVTVSFQPDADLSVSPSWLSPGASVTLSCDTKYPSAGWRFYWYKAVPDLSGTSYSYELLPGSIDGTEQDSYMIHGQTETAGFRCRAGRGDPEYYTHYSDPMFVWSGDLHPAASLTVNPDTVQHFGSTTVSLRCDGNSTKWRVTWSLVNGFLFPCSFVGIMNGSTCILNFTVVSNAVYWCESGSAFSNAVNITGQDNDGIILVSPVHPVTEGDSVTLGCKLRTQNVLSNVLFYKDDKLIQNDSRGEMSISAVSKSDEGFYKCQYSGKESPQSWMAVKKSSSENSSFPSVLITGLVCGVLLILILLFLLVCCCRKIKDPHWGRLSQSLYINQGSAVHQPESQNETQVYSSLLYGDASVYESIRGSGNTDSGGAASDYINVTSSHQP